MAFHPVLFGRSLSGIRPPRRRLSLKFYRRYPTTPSLKQTRTMAAAMVERLGGNQGQAWFCTTGLPSDIVVVVNSGMSFHLHKFPLMSKSRKLHRLITELEARGEDQEEEEELHRIALPAFPGGADTFEAAAKFCYGVKIDLAPSTVAPLRCAAQYLDMADDFAEDNLASRTERFLVSTVLRCPKDAARALKSCEDLLPAAEELGLVQRCIDSIAARACSSGASSRSLLSWPIKDVGAGVGVGVIARVRETEQWVDELTALSLPIYKRVVAAFKARELGSDAIEGSLVSYAKRSIPGISRSSRKLNSPMAAAASEPEQRELLETVITNLPLDKKRSSAPGPVTARFLFGLLRTANILRAPEALRSAAERKIASQLEDATVDDLLMPSYSNLADTLYDVDCVERILGHYLADVDEAGLVRVGRLVDGYLSEIASDANLTAAQFCGLALALPGHARRYDDGLYRAVDLYLKAHEGMKEEERERVSGVVDCGKLTMEACVHAAQNERLPVRAVVQVLLTEQLQLRRAVAGDGEGAWRTTARESQMMRLDMDSVRDRVLELELECAKMRKAIVKMDAGARGGGGGRRAVGWGSVKRRLGCRATTQVCDSHEPSVVVVETRRSRSRSRPPSHNHMEIEYRPSP